MDEPTGNDELLVALNTFVMDCVIFLSLCMVYINRRGASNGVVESLNVRKRYTILSRIPKQIDRLRDIVQISDNECIANLRMSMNAFARLSDLLEQQGGLSSSKHVTVSEQVAYFLIILSHHTKNCIVRGYYKRSGRTVSKYFNKVLAAVLKLHPIFLAKPTPIPEDEPSERWKWFKGCLGALDGTYIKVRVPKADRGRFRNRKGETSVNVLAVCNRDMKFIYVLSGWEGSAADSRVLRDAVVRPNGLKVPRGNYYLCDNGYTNGDGFLTPYRGFRYHKEDWNVGTAIPQNMHEFFNYKHSKARNVIERTFGLLKGRWGILRSAAYYPIKTQNKIIMACCLIHNYIRTVMSVDPQELVHNEFNEGEHGEDADFVDAVECRQQWINWRDTLANSMYQEFLGNH